jgi:hypothetical protein
MPSEGLNPKEFEVDDDISCPILKNITTQCAGQRKMTLMRVPIMMKVTRAKKTI